MMVSYVVSREADADLGGIFDYTWQQWGECQAHKYLVSLHKCADALATGKLRSRDLGNLVEGMKVVRCEHHYIFCRISPGKTPEIYAVFHEKMDLMARLAERLN
jgi:toxin ParE1/3/4